MQTKQLSRLQKCALWWATPRAGKALAFCWVQDSRNVGVCWLKILEVFHKGGGMEELIHFMTLNLCRSRNCFLAQGWNEIFVLSAAVALWSQLLLTWISLGTGSHCLQYEDWLTKAAFWLLCEADVFFSFPAEHPEIWSPFSFQVKCCLAPVQGNNTNNNRNWMVVQLLPKNQWYCVVQVKKVIVWHTVRYWAYLSIGGCYISKDLQTQGKLPALFSWYALSCKSPCRQLFPEQV